MKTRICTVAPIECLQAPELSSMPPMAELGAGESRSYNTYLGSFFSSYYLHYTSYHSYAFELETEGDARVDLIAVDVEGQESVVGAGEVSNGRIILPLSEGVLSKQAQRIYPLVTALSPCSVRSAAFTAETSSCSLVSIGLVISHFKQAELAAGILDGLFDCEHLQALSWKVFLVDNSRDFPQEKYRHLRVDYIPGVNLGGAGGFTRGLMKALEDDSLTHFLFLDDDVWFEPEVLRRLIVFYQGCKNDVVVAGSMLDMDEPKTLCEAGANYGVHPHTGEVDPFMMMPLRSRLDLSFSDSLDQLSEPYSCDYSGWFCSCFPRRIIEEIGLPYPLFIKLDDMEYGLRISENLQCPIVSLPGVFVWHKTFEEKVVPWRNYYFLRNILVVNLTRGKASWNDALQYTGLWLQHFLQEEEFTMSATYILACIDYLQGPKVLEDYNPVESHRRLSFQEPYKRLQGEPLVWFLQKAFIDPKRHSICFRFRIRVMWWLIRKVYRKRAETVLKDWKEAAERWPRHDFWTNYLKKMDEMLAPKEEYEGR